MADFDLQDAGLVVAAAAATAAVAYHVTRPSPPTLPYDLKNQSRLIPGKVFISFDFAPKKQDSLRMLLVS